MFPLKILTTAKMPNKNFDKKMPKRFNHFRQKMLKIGRLVLETTSYYFVLKYSMFLIQFNMI